MRLRQQEEPAALPTRMWREPTGQTETLAPVRCSTDTVRTPPGARLVRLMGLLGVALTLMGLLVSWTTGMSPLQWARSADVRKAYSSENLLYVRARALTSAGSVPSALAAIDALPGESEAADELLGELLPRAIATGDPDLILRVSTRGIGAGRRLVTTMPALAERLGAERVNALLKAPHLAAQHDLAIQTLVNLEIPKDPALAAAHLDWMSSGPLRDSVLQTLINDNATHQRWQEALRLVPRLSTSPAKFDGLLIVCWTLTGSGRLEEATRVLEAARPLRPTEQAERFDHQVHMLAAQYHQRGQTDHALDMVRGIQTPAIRYNAYSSIAQSLKGTESDATIERVLKAILAPGDSDAKAVAQSAVDRLIRRAPHLRDRYAKRFPQPEIDAP